MMRANYLSSLVMSGCLGVTALAALAWADDPVVFRSDVALVRVEAQVTDRSNRTITGLGPQDFVVREGGALQKIQSVDSENVPIDLLLLLDVSASMRPHIQRISAASHDALRQMRADDRIAIMVFDRSTRVRMGFGNSQDGERELERLLYSETFRGGTDITLGMYDAADFIRREGRPEARRAIVIVTDDETERNRDVDGVSRSLSRADAVMSALIAPDAVRARGQYGGGFPADPNGGGGNVGLGGIILGRPRQRYPGGGGYGSHTQSAGTREIALRSGGDALQVEDSYALQETLARIRQRYAIHFYLPTGVRPGEERYVVVQLADAIRNRYPGADVRYRQSYFAPTGSAPPPSYGNSPVVVSRAGSNDGGGSNDSPPVMRRRPAVSQPDSSSGPLIRDSGSNAPAPAAAPQSAPPSSTDSSTPSGGWRKARPEDLPH